jgi:hypothetical protein
VVLLLLLVGRQSFFILLLPQYLQYNTLVVYSLSEPAAKRAAHVVQASVVEVQIPINVQSDLKQWKQEVEDIKKKKGGHVHVKTDSNKVVIFAIPNISIFPYELN